MKIRWSIEQPTEWIGPFESGETYTTNHTWGVGDAELTFAAKSKDVFEEESDWNTITIYTSRDHRANFGIFERLFSNFPLINLFLKILIY